MFKLPLIDISDLFSSERGRWVATADQIGDAARRYGFFRITGHRIAIKDIRETYQMAERFFALPPNQKFAFYIAKSHNHRGYVPFTEKGDYSDETHRSYEAFDMGLDLPPNDPDYVSGNRLLGPNVWPDIPGFKDKVSSYYSQVASLGLKIIRCFELYLNLPDRAMTSKMQKPISQLRLLHYVREMATIDERSVNMGAHTDYECLTLLHTRNDGLQVMGPDDCWIDVPADEDVFVVNIGDMMEAWTNGLLRSTPHRVLNLRPERFSIPYFVAADYNTMIQPFPQLVTSRSPARYQPFMAGAHVERMLVRDFPYLRDKGRGTNDKTADITSITTKNPFETRIT